MNMTYANFVLMVLLSCLLSACGGSSSHKDLRDYITSVKEKPAGRIEEIPEYPPYESFIYGAASIRSPFDKPIDVKRRTYAKSNSNVKPDFHRAKEPLEAFDLNDLQMVGSLKRRGNLWALIKDGAGQIHQVSVGNYLGKNHGKIVKLSERQIELVEIVSDGLDGWVERPNLRALSEKE